VICKDETNEEKGEWKKEEEQGGRCGREGRERKEGENKIGGEGGREAGGVGGRAAERDKAKRPGNGIS